MKLFYITNGITGVGGLERVLSLKASYFADKLGYEIHIVSLDETGKKPFYKFSPQIIFHTIATKKNRTKYFTGIRRLVREIRADIILVCDDGLKGFFVPLWIGGKAKIIYERHTSKEMLTLGGKPNFKQKIYFSIMNIGSSLFDRFIVLTHANKKQWRGNNIEVIANPLSFYPDSASTLDQKRIIAVGKITYLKGFDRLVSVWELIGNKYPDWKIDIFGVCGDHGEFQQKTDGTPIHVNTPVQDIQGEYLSSSIYALPSRFEGFGMVLTEAMACGLPCVSFDCPCGPRDVIKDGEDGFLVENGNIEQFAEKLSVLIDNRNLRRKMGEKARENVRRYDIGIIAGQWDKLFRELTTSKIS